MPTGKAIDALETAVGIDRLNLSHNVIRELLLLDKFPDISFGSLKSGLKSAWEAAKNALHSPEI